MCCDELICMPMNKDRLDATYLAVSCNQKTEFMFVQNLNFTV